MRKYEIKVRCLMTREQAAGSPGQPAIAVMWRCDPSVESLRLDVSPAGAPPDLESIDEERRPYWWTVTTTRPAALAAACERDAAVLEYIVDTDDLITDDQIRALGAESAPWPYADQYGLISAQEHGDLALAGNMVHHLWCSQRFHSMSPGATRARGGR